MDRDRRICIVGSGAGGLVAALALRERGYANVTVLERLPDLPGGKCRTVPQDGLCCDTGAIFVLPNYPIVTRLAQQAGCHLRRSPPILHLREDGSTHPFGVPDPPVPLARKAAEFARIGGMLVRYRRLLFHPIGRVDQALIDDLSLPYREWVRKHRLDWFSTVVYPLMRTFGFGFEEQDIPAVYVFKTLAKFTDRGSWLSLWDPARLPLWRIEEGFGGIWKALCAGMDIRLGADVTRVERDGSGGVARTRDGREFPFDVLILASFHEQALEFLDASDEERAVFGRVRDFGAWQAIVRADGLGDAVLLDRNQAWSRLGHAMFYCRYAPGSDAYYLFGYSGDLSDADLAARVAEDVRDAGGRLLGEPILTRWPAYDPHFDGADLRQGLHARLEGLKGQNATWHVGALLDPFGVELVAQYAERLIRANFS